MNHSILLVMLGCGISCLGGEKTEIRVPYAIVNNSIFESVNSDSVSIVATLAEGSEHDEVEVFLFHDEDNEEFTASVDFSVIKNRNVLLKWEFPGSAYFYYIFGAGELYLRSINLEMFEFDLVDLTLLVDENERPNIPDNSGGVLRLESKRDSFFVQVVCQGVEPIETVIPSLPKGTYKAELEIYLRNASGGRFSEPLKFSAGDVIWNGQIGGLELKLSPIGH